MDTDKLEKTKEMLTKVLEFDEKISDLKEDRKTLIKEYVKENGLDLKAIEMAVRAIKKNIDLKEVQKIFDAIEPLISEDEK